MLERKRRRPAPAVAEPEKHVLLRVPTYGFLFKVIDFGMSTSPDLFQSPHDFGLMAMAKFGPLRYDNPGDVADPGMAFRFASPVFGNMPVGCFDCTRFWHGVNAMVYTSSFPEPLKQALHADITLARTMAMELGRLRGHTLSAMDVVAKPTRVSGAPAHASPEFWRDVDEVSKAAGNHHLRLELLVNLSRQFHYDITGTPDELAASVRDTFTMDITM